MTWVTTLLQPPVNRFFHALNWDRTPYNSKSLHISFDTSVALFWISTGSMSYYPNISNIAAVSNLRYHVLVWTLKCRTLTSDLNGPTWNTVLIITSHRNPPMLNHRKSQLKYRERYEYCFFIVIETSRPSTQKPASLTRKSSWEDEEAPSKTCNPLYWFRKGSSKGTEATRELEVLSRVRCYHDSPTSNLSTHRFVGIVTKYRTGDIGNGGA